MHDLEPLEVAGDEAEDQINLFFFSSVPPTNFRPIPSAEAEGQQNNIGHTYFPKTSSPTQRSAYTTFLLTKFPDVELRIVLQVTQRYLTLSLLSLSLA